LSGTQVAQPKLYLAHGPAPSHPLTRREPPETGICAVYGAMWSFCITSGYRETFDTGYPALVGTGPLVTKFQFQFWSRGIRKVEKAAEAFTRSARENSSHCLTGLFCLLRLPGSTRPTAPGRSNKIPIANRFGTACYVALDADQGTGRFGAVRDHAQEVPPDDPPGTVESNGARSVSRWARFQTVCAGGV